MKFSLEELDEVFEDWLVASFYGNTWSARRKNDSPVDGKKISGTSFHDWPGKSWLLTLWKDRMPLFNPHLVYPSDEIGPYLELVGVIVEKSKILGDGEVKIKIMTDRGQFIAYVCEHMAGFARKAKWARVRVYDAGGGWYPDNRIMSLSMESLLHEETNLPEGWTREKSR